MLLSEVPRPFKREGWGFELKYGGWRCLPEVNDGRASQRVGCSTGPCRLGAARSVEGPGHGIAAMRRSAQAASHRRAPLRAIVGRIKRGASAVATSRRNRASLAPTAAPRSCRRRALRHSRFAVPRTCRTLHPQSLGIWIALPNGTSWTWTMKSSTYPTARWTAAAIAAGALTAAWVRARARRAEREHPPTGRLLEVDGVRLHVVERGAGPPVVLIHGNLVTHRDFVASGLVQRLATDHRVIAFDRPGYGHSTRPRDRRWTQTAQAHLLHQALRRLGVDHPVIVGHSMGAMVAMLMALEHPADVGRLVLLSGYYEPTVRLDAWLMSPVALPVLGDVAVNTALPVWARLTLPLALKAMFEPKEVPADYLEVVSDEMMMRPVQLRANAEDAAFMVRQAKRDQKRHGELRMPVAILAGADDQIVDPQAHSVQLHEEIPDSTLTVLPEVGHMVHHAAAETVVAAVKGGDAVSARYKRPAVATV